ncbi:MAG: hypothetical protein HQ567_22605 [Candidatus Nealsonbacteria bacterium]|nr:hypothetical protein [Candidatus Nealsonbacteria bacterium]
MFRLCVLVVAISAISVSQAATVVIDGDLTDWGISLDGDKHLVFGTGITNVSTHPGYQGVLNNFQVPNGKLYYHAEDSNDLSNNYAVGPNLGGQNYDAEFLGASVLDSVLYVAIATGQRPDNRFSKFSPGDLRIETSVGIFGMEIGGGTGDSSRTDGQIGLGAPGTTYTLWGNGATRATDLLPPGGPLSPPYQTAGSLWATHADDWIADPIGPPTDVQFQIGIGGANAGTYAGAATQYIYNYDSDFGQHAFIEFKVDTALFGGGKIESIAWRPSCGNDELELALPEESPPEVPEPASLIVWSVLVALAVGCCWQRCSGRKQR